MKFSKEQELALTLDNGNMLVSASAGSGKTAVLTERVYRIIKSGVALNQILVLTFTNLAASEMRNRIRDKLLKGGYSSLASLVDSVDIQTYDAYFLSIVKKYFYKLNLSSNVTVVDKDLIDLETKKRLRKILDEKYIKGDKDIEKLIYHYCLKNDSKIFNGILYLFDEANKKSNPIEYISNFVENHIKEDFIKENIDEYVNLYKKTINEVISSAKYINDTSLADTFLDVLSYYDSSVDSVDDIYSLFNDENKPDWPRMKNTYEPEDKLICGKIKAKVNSFINEYASNEEIINHVLSIKNFAQTLVNITIELYDSVEEFKRKFSVYTFQDIAKFAMEIVKDKEINKKIKNQYKYIMIDEYQDTSDLQEEFISLIENNNVYVVGDVKQSIYGFRNANCELFLNKFNRYKNNNGGTLVNMSNNFRSRGEVLNDINKIFSEIMTISNTGLDYSKDHVMNYGNRTYELAKDNTSNYETEIIAYSKADLPKSCVVAEYEATLVAKDIINRYNRKEQVANDEKNGTRDIDFKDFAILSFAKTNFPYYQKVFNKFGIPLYANFDKDINDNDLTLVLKNIIKLISLYRNDEFGYPFVHPYISLMRSFLFEISDEEVEKVAKTHNYFDYPIYDIIKDISSRTNILSNKELMFEIIEKFNINEKIMLIGDVNDNNALLSYFVNIASQMDAMNYSIDDMSQYFDDLDKFEIETSISNVDSIDNSVKLLSIHASKGLQFKYIYYVGLHENRIRSDKSSIFFDDRYGMSMPNELDKHYNDFFIGQIKSKKRLNDVNEQLRVLYVALTRAEEKMILVKQLDYKKNIPNEFINCNSYLDFINLTNLNFNVCSLSNDESLSTLPIDNDNDYDLNVYEPYKFNDETFDYKRISKQKSDDVDIKTLELGNKYHYYLELLDFKTKDTSFIIDKKDRAIIDKFIKNPLFNNLDNATVLHEYAFYDEENERKGVIDLMIVYDDHIDIIDFKLSHIDDLAYDRQVSLYKDYISKIANGREINTYIFGIFSGLTRKVN